MVPFCNVQWYWLGISEHAKLNGEVKLTSLCNIILQLRSAEKGHRLYQGTKKLHRWQERCWSSMFCSWRTPPSIYASAKGFQRTARSWYISLTFFRPFVAASFFCTIWLCRRSYFAPCWQRVSVIFTMNESEDFFSHIYIFLFSMVWDSPLFVLTSSWLMLLYCEEMWNLLSNLISLIGQIVKSIQLE